MAEVIPSAAPTGCTRGANISAFKYDPSCQFTKTCFEMRNKPAVRRYKTCQGRVETLLQGDDSENAYHKHSCDRQCCFRNLQDQVIRQEGSSFHGFGDRRVVFQTAILPATPSDFAELFPSSRKLHIYHDDSNLDAELNIRVETAVITPNGGLRHISLFHLRIYDLKGREFSLRRYARDSGREICRTSYKQLPRVIDKKPILQRSLSSALAPFRSKTELKSSSPLSLKRYDSGYDSICDVNQDVRTSCLITKTPPRSPSSPDILSLTFSNYSHVELRRRGRNSNVRYEFEYWGNRYVWRRNVNYHGKGVDVRYRLGLQYSDQTLAEINPLPVTSAESLQQSEIGGWIPPYSLSLTAEGVMQEPTEISDVVVATGLLCLVDDTFRRNFCLSTARELIVPAFSLSPVKLNLNFTSPKRCKFL